MERKDPVLPNVPEWDETERLAREKEALGFFISGHPLDRFREVVRAFDGVTTASLAEHAGKRVELACVVTSVSRQISRRDNSEWGKVVVEDFLGTATVLAFKETWQGAKDTLAQDAVVLLRGVVSNRERDEEDPPLFLDEVEPLEVVAASGRLALQIEIEFGSEVPAEAFAKARTVLAAHPGLVPVELAIGNGGGGRLRSRTLKADVGNGTMEELQAVFGRNRVRLVRVGGDLPQPEEPRWKQRAAAASFRSSDEF
jgi:DNA polymerase-3 subunit alpha